MIEDDPFVKPKKKSSHEIGCDLSSFSVEELGERVIFLQEEILRLNAAAKLKKLKLSEAENFFKKV
jgi:uncharacterized small protein (DUF1192 family)